MRISINNKIVIVVTFILYFFIDWVLLSIFDCNPFILFIVQLILVLITFSPIGGYIMRLIYDCQKVITEKDKDRLTPLFKEVLLSARKEVPDLNLNINLYIDNSNQVNAYAMGSNTVVITRGALLQLNDEQIKGILSHEVGHLVHGDTFLSIFFLIGNSIFLFFLLLYKMVVWYFQIVALTLEDERMKPKAINLFFGSIATFCLLIINALTMLNQRHNEHQADYFAFKIGYGKELINALYYLSNMQIGQKLNIIERIKSSHPNIYRRIASLEKLY